MLRHPPGPSPHASSAVASLAVAPARPDWSNLDDIDVPLRQLSLSHAIDEASHQHLLSSAPDTRSALSSGLPHAGDWLNVVVPSAPLGLHLQDREFRCCLRYWLVHSDTYTCPECLGSADPFGDHQVGCAGHGDCIARHNAVRDVLFNAAQSAALAPTKEAPNLVPGSSARPADILLPYWCRGRPAALDVSVISPLQRLTLADAASTQGHALRYGVHRKLTSNLPACQVAGVDFPPIVVETLGGWCHTIRSIGRALGQRLNSTDPYDMTKHLFGRLAIALWRGNAGLWLHGHPSLPSTIDGQV